MEGYLLLGFLGSITAARTFRASILRGIGAAVGTAAGATAAAAQQLRGSTGRDWRYCTWVFDRDHGQKHHR